MCACLPIACERIVSPSIHSVLPRLNKVNLISTSLITTIALQGRPMRCCSAASGVVGSKPPSGRILSRNRVTLLAKQAKRLLDRF